MKWSYEYPPQIPIRVECDVISHSQSNNWTCLDVTCPCKIPGLLAWRDRELRHLKDTASKQDTAPTDILPFFPLPDMPASEDTYHISRAGQRHKVTWKHTLKLWLRDLLSVETALIAVRVAMTILLCLSVLWMLFLWMHGF